MKCFAVLALLLGACWADNPNFSRRTTSADMAPAAMPCPSATTPASGGKGRPELRIPGGPYQIEGVSFVVPDFFLDVFEVSVSAYRDCVQAGSCTKPDAVAFCNWSDAPGDREDHPINCVTWVQANTFCSWAGRRLPTEAEWEYTAAGMKMSAYPWGNDDPAVGASAQACWRQGMAGTCPEGSHQRTLFGAQTCTGLADLGGNVWEWTGSEFVEPYVHPAPPCSTSARECSVRGGSWDIDEPLELLNAQRHDIEPSFSSSSTGFRCGRSGP